MLEREGGREGERREERGRGRESDFLLSNSGSADLCYSINKLLNTETNTITTVTSQRLRSSSLNSSNNNINKPPNNDKEEEQEEENNGKKE